GHVPRREGRSEFRSWGTLFRRRVRRPGSARARPARPAPGPAPPVRSGPAGPPPAGFRLTQGPCPPAGQAGAGSARRALFPRRVRRPGSARAPPARAGRRPAGPGPGPAPPAGPAPARGAAADGVPPGPPGPQECRARRGPGGGTVTLEGVAVVDVSEELKSLSSTMESIEAVLDLDRIRADIAVLEEQAAAPSLWDNPDEAQKITSKLSHLQAEVRKAETLRGRIDDL